LIIGAGLAVSLVLAAAPTFTGKVVGVPDGDTLVVLNGRETVRVRLEGIDCPELGQGFGRNAKRFTSSLIYKKRVEVRGKEWDRLGRLVARVSIGGRDVSLELVRAGLAWHFTWYSSDKQLAEAEREARAEKRELWLQPHPTPPWEWRRHHSDR
jgi:micrococcal nuclease